MVINKLNKYSDLVPDCFYHFYNRANGNEKLFLKEDHYFYFLKKFKEYIDPLAETFCYCLMPNHFHFLIKIRDRKTVLQHYASFDKKIASHLNSHLTGFQNEKVSRLNSHLTGFENLSGVDAEFIDETQNKEKNLSGVNNEFIDETRLKEATLSDIEISNFISKQFGNFFNAYSKAFNKQQNRRGSLFMRPFKRILVKDEKYLLNLINYIHFNPVEAGLCESLEKWKFSSYQTIIENKESFINRNDVIEWYSDIDNFIFNHQSLADFDIEL